MPATAAQAFDAWCRFLAPTEGGFTNDPRDGGNWTGGSPGSGLLKGTNFGIAASAHPDLDIANLTIEEANALRKSEYWDKVRGDELPPSLALLVADAVYGSGPKVAIEHLQATLGVVADGIFGDQTMAAVGRVVAGGVCDDGLSSVSDLLAEFCSRRLLFEADLAVWTTFKGGWTRRLFRSQLLALSLA